MTIEERHARVNELIRESQSKQSFEGDGDRAREIAKLLGISVTRARRVLNVGIEQEATQYEKDNPQKKSKCRNYHDRLYDKAMSLAVDADDMDVVEHYCQGHIDRLKTFIDARTRPTAKWDVGLAKGGPVDGWYIVRHYGDDDVVWELLRGEDWIERDDWSIYAPPSAKHAINQLANRWNRTLSPGATESLISS